MATKGAITRRQWLGIARRELLSAPNIVSLVILLTVPYWLMPAFYALLLSYRATPSGAIVWIYVLGVTLLCLWGWISFLRGIVIRAKRMRTLKLAAESKEPKAVAEYRAEKLRPLGEWGHAIGVVGIYLLIPGFLAIQMWGSWNRAPELVRARGRLRYERPGAALNRVIQEIEKRGIFTPVPR